MSMDPISTERQFLSVPEAGRILGVQHSRAYALAAESVFPTVRIGRVIRVPRAAFEVWLEAQTIAALANVKTPEDAP